MIFIIAILCGGWCGIFYVKKSHWIHKRPLTLSRSSLKFSLILSTFYFPLLTLCSWVENARRGKSFFLILVDYWTSWCKLIKCRVFKEFSFAWKMTNNINFHKVSVLRGEWDLPDYYLDVIYLRRSAFGIFW